MDRRYVAGVFAALALAAPLAARGTPADDAQQALEQARADAVGATRTYRASLERLLPYGQDAVHWAAVTVENRRRLFAMGAASRVEVEAAERALEAAEAKLAATRADIVHAERLLAEAIAATALPPLAPGVMAITATVVQRFFTERFGRPLPISALGQTPVHDRLGFDHRNALDVALHPDSAEGQALIAWLRGQSVSFLAFRGPVAGEATGAHVHIGEPSPRRGG
jgi:hypothetical protein